MAYGKRLLRAFTRYPWSLGAALGMLLFFFPHPEWHTDLGIFRDLRNMPGLPYPYHFRWLVYTLAWLPEPAAYLLISLGTIASLYAASRVFGGRHWFVFTSYAFAWTLFYGQTDGLVLGGLALAWWAIQKRKAYLVGAGLLLASMKPQLSAFLILALWWWSPSRWKALVVPGIVAAVSFAQWGFWIPGWIQYLTQSGQIIDLPRNISLWNNTGPWIWLIWPMVFALPLPRPQKMIAIASASVICAPYFPMPSSILLLVLPVPVVVYLALQASVLAGWVGPGIYDLTKLIPCALLAWTAWPAIRDWISAPCIPGTVRYNIINIRNVMTGTSNRTRASRERDP